MMLMSLLNQLEVLLPGPKCIHPLWLRIKRRRRKKKKIMVKSQSALAPLTFVSSNASFPHLWLLCQEETTSISLRLTTFEI